MSEKYVVVRSPGHWIHVGIMDRMDEREIRLIGARVVRRFTNDPIGLTTSSKGATVNETRADVLITNGPGVFIYECKPGVWD